jgi:anthranilate phosphoribosyltransferase
LTFVLRALARHETVSTPEMHAAFGVVMRGEATPVQAAALLMGLRARGESADELAGAARALRDAMVVLPADRPDELVDTCGTGGGAVSTFNISTAAAFVAAAAGVRVAKHGNRSFTSRCGSADVIEALGVPLDVPVEVLAEVLDRAGIVFMFAPAMHPAMRHLAPIRRELGVPTIMNAVGPLANPAAARRQVIGVGDPARLELVAAAVRTLGTAHTLVVHGAPGLDEISPLGPTAVIEICGDAAAAATEVRRWSIDPADHGLAGGAASELAAGDPAENAVLITRVLRGDAPPAARAAVALNAGAAIYVAGRAATYSEAVTIACATLDAGRGFDALRQMLAVYASLV